MKTIALAGVWLIALGAVAFLFLGRGQAVAPAAPPTLPPTATATASVGGAAYGKALFVAKGCASCHSHRAFTSATESFGPNLSDYELDPDFARRWLADPAALRPNTRMPKLNLSAEEIEALIAFLQQQ